MPFLFSKPRMLLSDFEIQHKLPQTVIESPDLNMDMSAATKQSPLSSLQKHIEHWDKIAEDFETFDEQFNKAEELLNETKQIIHEAIEKISDKKRISDGTTIKQAKRSSQFQE
jgi:hypothetical protein